MQKSCQSHQTKAIEQANQNQTRLRKGLRRIRTSWAEAERLRENQQPEPKDLGDERHAVDLISDNPQNRRKTVDLESP